jgi:hypothetical protein
MDDLKKFSFNPAIFHSIPLGKEGFELNLQRRKRVDNKGLHPFACNKSHKFLHKEKDLKNSWTHIYKQIVHKFPQKQIEYKNGHKHTHMYI